MEDDAWTRELAQATAAVALESPSYMCTMLEVNKKDPVSRALIRAIGSNACSPGSMRDVIIHERPGVALCAKVGLVDLSPLETLQHFGVKALWKHDGCVLRPTTLSHGPRIQRQR